MICSEKLSTQYILVFTKSVVLLIGSRNSQYPWIFTVLRTERKMAHRFAKVLEEKIEEAFFYPSDLVSTKATTPLRVGEER